jgi:hypothetical protein
MVFISMLPLDYCHLVGKFLAVALIRLIQLLARSLNALTLVLAMVPG